jgi:hypothetical protein
MYKRSIVGFAWFMATAYGMNLVVAVADLPSWLSLGVAAAVAAFVAIDPLGAIWTRAVAMPTGLESAPANSRFGGLPDTTSTI